CSGVWYSSVQMPCRSGSFHGVAGAFRALLLNGTAPIFRSRTMTTARMPIDARSPRPMEYLPGDTRGGEVVRILPYLRIKGAWVGAGRPIVGRPRETPTEKRTDLGV